MLALFACVALVLSIRKKDWIISAASLGLMIAPGLLFLDPRGLFYHSIGLMVICLVAFTIVSLLLSKAESNRAIKSIILIVLPFIALLGFKLFQLQGIEIAQWFLLVGIVAFIYLTFERRKFDATWFILLFVVCASAQILIS